MHNDSDEDLHVAVVSVAEDRTVQVVYGRDAKNVVRAHGHEEVVVWIGAHPGWPADRPLVDRYVAVATARFTDFLPFESDAEPGALRGEQAGNPWGTASCDLQVVSPAAFEAGAKTVTPSDTR